MFNLPHGSTLAPLVWPGQLNRIQLSQATQVGLGSTCKNLHHFLYKDPYLDTIPKHQKAQTKSRKTNGHLRPCVDNLLPMPKLIIEQDKEQDASETKPSCRGAVRNLPVKNSSARPVTHAAFKLTASVKEPPNISKL